MATLTCRLPDSYIYLAGGYAKYNIAIRIEVVETAQADRIGPSIDP
jgi:hypothetical protein